ncbi:FtsX-like permease family protein [Kitasatospora sp. NPDC057198]|uniref:FtsX-like permease family protein n=1 Tax=Kitasatospora sp. NPDC057198 TaxID=3346046 RepID=UPI00363F38BA
MSARRPAGVVWMLAVATLRRRWTGFVGAFLALALGTAMIGMMALALTATFGTPYPGPQRFQASTGTVVAPLGFEGRVMPAPAVLPDDLVAKVSAAGKATADRSFPVRTTTADGTAGRATGHGWSAAGSAGYRLTAGRAPQAPDEVVLGGGDARLVGQQVGAGGEYRVVGVTDARWFETAVFFTDEEARRRSPGVNLLVSELPAGQLAQLVGDSALVLGGADRKDVDPDDTGGAEALANAQAMAGSTTGLAVCVAVFVVVATFALATEQRRRELALLRLVGAAPRQVRRMVLGEAALLGAAAALVGCLLAPLGAGPLRDWMVRHDVAPAWFTVPVNPLPLLVAFLLGLGAALAGSAATLVRVSRVRPAEVLREAAVERRALTPVRLVLGGAMLVGAVAGGLYVAGSEPYLASSARKYQAIPVLYVGAVALLAPVLLRPVTRLLTWPLRRSRQAGPLLVRANLLTSGRRTAAVVAPIVVAVGLVGTLMTVQRSADATVLDRQRQDVHATDVVTAGGAGLDAGTLERLAAVPGVRVTPVTAFTLKLGTPDGQQLDSLSVQAVPASAFGTVLTPRLTAGSLTALPDDYLVIDEHAAESDDLAVGDELVALLPTGARVKVTVAAVVARGLGGDAAYLSATATAAAGIPPTRAYLDAPGGASDGVPDRGAPDQGAVRAALGDSGAELTSYGALLEAGRAEAAEQTDNAAVVILGIALAYALISVVNTLVMAVAARRGEFALLALAGAVRGQVLRMAAAESAVAVVVGTVLAAAATALTALTQRLSLTHLVGAAPTSPAWPQFLATTALCAAVTALTATLAAGRATKRGASE